jgi:hypothetical protein
MLMRLFGREIPHLRTAIRLAEPGGAIAMEIERKVTKKGSV